MFFAPHSRPSSRAPSPTRTNSRVSLPSSSIPPPTRSSTIDTGTSIAPDELSDYFGSTTTASTPALTSGFNTPHYGAYSDGPTASGAMTPGGSYFPHMPVEIILDSENLVMRGQGGDMNPAYLSGRVELNLSESTNIKEINMSLHGKAKVQFAEGSGTGSKNHHHTHEVLSHDWSFLQGDKKHTHTLKAGHHTFPFSLMLHGNLPSSIHTFPGDAIIYYKLRATVVRSGFASNFHHARHFTLHRTFTSDALEFNQTLEIENTWPGKVMYSLTLPYKAYAAGDEIPVNVKFMPLAKGVKVTNITSTVQEYTLVHTRHSNHADQRVVASVRHQLRDGRAYLAHEERLRPPSHWDGTHAHTISRRGSTTPARTPRGSIGGSGNASEASSGNAAAGPSSEPAELEDPELSHGDDEIDTHFTIPIPPWTTASHSIHPAFITHKIKWSCSISNADGHVSELRCALPILILDNSLLEEARAAGASTRGLLFGGAASEEAQQVDLPSYSNHVYDRIAIADSGNAAGYAPRGSATPGASSHSSVTPPMSRGPSRPGSPTGSRHDVDDDLPPRRELSSWADSELLLSLGSLRVHSNGSSPQSTPPTSRGPSRPLSRRNSRSGRSSRVGSRANSRASSPERPAHGGVSPMIQQEERPAQERRHTGGFGSLLHLPASLKHHKPILRNSSHIGLTSMTPADGIQRNASSFSNLNDRRSNHQGNSRVQFANEPPSARARFHFGGSGSGPAGDSHHQHDHDGDGEADGGEDGEEQTDPLNQVPSYAIASRGFLGGGVTPIDVGLPTYDDSERSTGLQRAHRSDTALVELGARAAAEAEGRAEEPR